MRFSIDVRVVCCIVALVALSFALGAGSALTPRPIRASAAGATSLRAACADLALARIKSLTKVRPEVLIRDRQLGNAVLFAAPIPSGTIFLEWDCKTDAGLLRSYVDWNNKTVPVNLGLSGPIRVLHAHEVSETDFEASMKDQLGRTYLLHAPRIDRIEAGDAKEIGAALTFDRWTTSDLATASVADGNNGPFLFVSREQDRWPNGLLWAATAPGPDVAVGPVHLQIPRERLRSLLGQGRTGHYCVGPGNNNCLEADEFQDASQLIQVVSATYYDQAANPHQRVVAIRVSPLGDRSLQRPQVHDVAHWLWGKISIFAMPRNIDRWVTTHWDPSYARYCDGFWCAEIRKSKNGSSFYIGP